MSCACGATAERGICAPCNRAKTRAFRARRREQGLCIRCSQPARPGGLLCEAHRQEVTDKERRPGAPPKKNLLQRAAMLRELRALVGSRPYFECAWWDTTTGEIKTVNSKDPHAFLR